MRIKAAGTNESRLIPIRLTRCDYTRGYTRSTDNNDSVLNGFLKCREKVLRNRSVSGSGIHNPLGSGFNSGLSQHTIITQVTINNVNPRQFLDFADVKFTLSGMRARGGFEIDHLPCSDSTNRSGGRCLESGHFCHIHFGYITGVMNFVAKDFRSTVSLTTGER